MVEQPARKPFSLMDVRINTYPLDMLLPDTITAIEGGPRITFACANPHSLVEAQKDKEFFSALQWFDHVVADGVGVTLAAKLKGRFNIPRITGADYYFTLMAALNEMGGKKVFFLGSTEAVLSRIRSRALTEYPNIAAIETFSPPFGEWSDRENAEILEKINSFAPDALWVGMTAPRQEKWIFRSHNNLDTPFVGAIGAVFDFYAGTYRRAPVWMREWGMEWLYRLSKEPRRMWKRNFVSAPKFFSALLRHRFQG